MVKLQKFNQKVRASLKRPEIKAGDIVKIHRKIREGNKERIQIFEGIVIAVKGKQSSSPMITVRRVSFGVGVEITVPVYSPAILKIEVIKHAKVRRSKLYYLRKKDYKVSKLKTKELAQFVAEEEKEEQVEEGAENREEKEKLEKKEEKKPEENKEKESN
jgi:large subunit ribosomal protein L19